MANFIAYLSDGRILNSKDYNYPGQKTPWAIMVDLLNDQNIHLLRQHYGEQYSNEELISKYRTDYTHELHAGPAPNLIRVVNIQLEVNGIIYNSASTSRRSRFYIDPSIKLEDYRAYKEVDRFWIFNRLDCVIQDLNNQDRYISFSFVVDGKYRFFQWVDIKTNESYVEICGLDDVRNLRVEKELI